mgnify:FL=1
MPIEEKWPAPKNERSVPPEAPLSTPEKSRGVITHNEYFSSVSRYFNGRIADCKIGEADEDNNTYENFLWEQQRVLQKMADPKRLEKMHPRDVSFALAELSGTLADTNPESPRNNFLDANLGEEDNQAKEELYLATKKLYMDSCAKMFSDTQITSIVSELNTGVRRIKREMPHIPLSESLDSISETQALLRDNPKELLKRLDDVLYQAGTGEKSHAYYAFEAWIEHEESLEAAEIRLGTLAEPMYKLQLIKDELLRKIYGTADMKPSERMRIDQLKSSLKNS